MVFGEVSLALGPLAIAAIPAAIKLAGDVWGAKSQQRFERNMSNTAYQRAVRDMVKAGLNPALAYSQGGASTPSVSAVSPGSGLMEAVGSAVRVAKVDEPKAKSEVDLNTSLSDQAKAGTLKAQQETQESMARQAREAAQAALLRTENAREMAKLPKEQLYGIGYGHLLSGYKKLDELETKAVESVKSGSSKAWDAVKDLGLKFMSDYQQKRVAPRPFEFQQRVTSGQDLKRKLDASGRAVEMEIQRP